MKKFLSSVILIILACVTASAQDIIVTKDSERIDAKILEVSDTEVSYKKAGYVEGPTFVMKTSEISSIIYSNGDVQTFNFVSQDEIVKNKKIKFNPEPVARKRPFGLSIGYVSKQIDNMGAKVPWVGFTWDDKRYSPALRVGLWYAPEFGYGIGLQTGIYYELSYSHYKGDIYDSGYLLVKDAKLSLMEHNLSLPLRIQYRYEIIPDLSIFIYTGPSFDFSVAYDATVTLGNESETISLYSKEMEAGMETSFNRYNILWGIGGGIRWKGLQLSFSGDWGLTYLVKDYSGTKLNKPFSVSLQYLF